MQCKLRVLDGGQAGTEITVRGPKFLIGREADCQLRPRSDMVSRHHCVLMLEPGQLSVRDFKSRNGTLVNDVRIEGVQTLKSGDELRIGPLRFEVVLIHEVSGKRKPKVKDVKEAASRTSEMAGEIEHDISHWLEDEAEAEPENTETINMPRTGETSHVLTDPDGQSPDKKKSNPPRKYPAGRDPSTSSSKNSQCAAEDLLRKLERQMKKKQEGHDKK